MSHSSPSLAVLVAACLAAACTTPPVTQRAAVLDYLYPTGSPVTPATDVHLVLPLRVGLAFAPGGTATDRTVAPWDWNAPYQQVFDAASQQGLLERIASAFRDTEGVASIEIVPESYLRPGGGFENVDQLRSMLGIDLLAMVSYDQTQLQDFDRSSLAYWTVVGAYFVEGNENETHTFVDVTVFDIPSHALLFNAAGRSRLENESTALEANDALRRDSRRGFEQAIDDALVQLAQALERFREQAKTGTVRGAGTPKLEVSGEGAGGGSGAGALGALEACLALGLLIAWRRERRAAARS